MNFFLLNIIRNQIAVNTINVCMYWISKTHIILVYYKVNDYTLHKHGFMIYLYTMF